MRKYWRGIAIAGVVAVISGCGAASGSKTASITGISWRQQPLPWMRRKGRCRGRGISFCGTAAGAAIRNREYGNSRNRPKADQNCQHGR